MNRLTQTDTNRLNAAETSPSHGQQQQSELMSSEAVHNFRRLMGDDEEATGTPSGGESEDAISTAMEDALEASSFKNGKELPSNGEIHAAAKNVQHGTQTADEHFFDRTQGTESHPRKKIDENDDTDDNAEIGEIDENVENNENDGNAFSGMTNPFSRLLSDTLSKMQPAPVDAVPSTSTADLAEKLVERILVSQPDKNGQEIRLLLSQESGMNAEVHIVRDLGGSLSIALHAEDPTTFQNLVAAQDRLKATLEAQERGAVRVEVLSRTDQENNDHNRRSQGYMPPESED